MSDNPMAFPTHDAHPGTDPRSQILTGGMTLRDYFAGQALAGVLADGALQVREADCPAIAATCYDIADALLAARKAPAA